MALPSGYETTLKFLEEKGVDGASLNETLEIGISRPTFFRHKKMIEQTQGVSVETFLGLDGVTKYRIKRVGEKPSSTFHWLTKPLVVYGNGHQLDGVLSKLQENVNVTMDSEVVSIVDSPSLDFELLNDAKWEKLRLAIDKRQLIEIKEYECESWEKYPIDPIILPLSIIMLGSEYLLKGIWIYQELQYEVFLNVSGIIKYSLVKKIKAPGELSNMKPRWQNVVIGVKSLENRIRSEIWHPSQQDFADVGSLFGEDFLLVSQISEKSMSILEDGHFKFIRIIPLANEMTLARIYQNSSNIRIIQKEYTY